MAFVLRENDYCYPSLDCKTVICFLFNCLTIISWRCEVLLIEVQSADHLTSLTCLSLPSLTLPYVIDSRNLVQRPSAFPKKYHCEVQVIFLQNCYKWVMRWGHVICHIWNTVITNIFSSPTAFCYVGVSLYVIVCVLYCNFTAINHCNGNGDLPWVSEKYCFNLFKTLFWVYFVTMVM